MNETPKNPAAVALGRMAAGKPKNYSPAEREKRAQRMREMRAKIILDRACATSQTQESDHEKESNQAKQSAPSAHFGGAKIAGAVNQG